MERRDELLPELRRIKRRMGKAVDWACKDPKNPKDAIILDLFALAQKAVQSLPESCEAVIRWTPEDFLEKAQDLGLRLGRKRAAEMCANCAGGLEEVGVSHGWDVVEDAIVSEVNRRERR